MARSATKGLLLLGVAGVGAVVLWPTISQAVRGGTSHPSGGGGGSGSGGSGCAFIPGQQYVGASGTGFVVVIGGQKIGVFQTQSAAEQAYNKALGC